MKALRFALAILSATALVPFLAIANAATPAATRPQPAIPAIVCAFASHPVVAIAESHGVRQAGDFYVALVRDTAFQRTVNDIVIEFASGQSQPLLDRYVLAGAWVPPETLRTIWRNTTKVASWEYPIYARWLDAVREVNRALPPGRRIRVLAGDTPVDWSRLRGPSDWEALGDNNVSFASVIANQVLAAHRRALAVLGGNHLMRTGTRDGGPNTTTRVEALHPGAMHVVWLSNGRPGGDDVDARITDEHWPRPSLVSLRGTWIGQIAAGAHRFEDIADDLLYLGPARELVTEQAPATSFDSAYVVELDRRSWIEWGDSTRARRFLGLGDRR